MPARFAPIVFGLILSGLMSCIVSGVSTWRAVGMVPDFGAQWMSAWSVSWPVAFAVVITVGPFVRRFVDRLVRDDPPADI